MSNISYHHTVRDLNAKLSDTAKNYTSIFILCDENTEQLCLPLITDAIANSHIISIRSGEQHKTLDTCDTIWSALTAKAADRKALLINLGGGVICDMGGFAAACYKRGIDFIHIPTTLLAMVDASVGGKTGIDFKGYKNQIGVFREAVDVLICPDFLQTLDERQIRSGMAEVVKHYLIADAAAFHTVAKNNTLIPDFALIEKAVQIKSQFVAADPYEAGVRKALNFGHTIGHAIESHYLQSAEPLLHGEAIAIGMAVETIISNRMGLLSEGDTDEILTLIKALFPVRLLPQADIDHIITLTAQDKKNTAGTRNFVLLTGPGSYRIDVEVGEEMMHDACVWYNNGM